MHPTETASRPRGHHLVPVLFTATIFLSAALLFFVQPLFTKIVLPTVGGAPAVWTTAMLFFQTVLIGGYLYAHLLTRHVPQRWQVVTHIALWAAALAFLPLTLPAGWSYDPAASPAWSTLTLFALGVGVPFAVLSANAPLIQSWYARTGGPSADDPYFLYGASNLGSLLALLAFPFLAEPFFGASDIGRGWALGFGLLGIGLAISGLSAGRGARTRTETRRATPLSAKTIAYWLILAFVPSSLMLAITSKISTDVGSIPMVWVVPLSLYLLTFVLVFTNRPLLRAGTLHLGAALGVTVLGIVWSGLTGPHLSWGWVGAMVAAFFAVALFAHGKLYAARPDESRLTLFYVIMSVGGALGGLFNSILAPWLFNGLYEGGLTTLIVVLLLVRGWDKIDRRVTGLAIGFGILAALPVIGLRYAGIFDDKFRLGLVLIAFVILAVLSLRRALPAAAIAATLAIVIGGSAIPNNAIHRDRGFFGTHTVSNTDTLRLYSHGTTVHGAERLADLATGGKPTPLFYYHPKAPMAQVITSPRGQEARTVGIVGQGVGSLACYGQPGQSWAFYEIDPIVDEIARNPHFFTFMSECAGDAPTFIGDARIVMAGQAGVTYDLLVIDAYSSDAVPVHLTTLEAMSLYVNRLAPGGILLFHISNRYYDIDRPLGRAARALGLDARIQRYHGNMEADPSNTPSAVVMLARNATDLGALADDPRWAPLPSDGGPVWTDDHAHLLSILK